MSKNKKKIIVAMSPHKSLRDSVGQAGGVKKKRIVVAISPPVAGQAGGVKKKRIVVAMSGGVDSSVAAKLLKNQGHELMGIFLHFWKDSDSSAAENKCCSLSALQDARRVCQNIGIPLYTLNFSEIFKKQVVDNFLDEYENGRTPNPCVRCNKLVKLGLLISKAKELGFDYVASGHYACLRQEAPNDKSQITNKIPASPAGRQNLRNNHRQGGTGKTKFIYKLFRAKDKSKDQSYFLWSLSQEQLSHLLFPLDNYTKPEVRRLAKKFNLPVATKSESQEVCFIPEKSHNEFLKRNIKIKPGPIKLLPHHIPLPALPARLARLDSARLTSERAGRLVKRGDEVERKCEIIGKHQGLPLYTVGQRKGIEIGGIGPFYAVRMDYKKNILYVTDKRDDPALFSSQFKVKNVNWISGGELKMPLECRVVIRYRHAPVKAKIRKQESNHRLGGTGKTRKQGEYLVELAEPQRAVTSGQSAVFYIKDEVIGGGIIV